MMFGAGHTNFWKNGFRLLLILIAFEALDDLRRAKARVSV
jgi:hypothetical protein